MRAHARMHRESVLDAEPISCLECPGQAPIRGTDQWNRHLEERHDEQLRYFVGEPQVLSVKRSAEDLNKEEDMPAPERMRRDESVVQDVLATTVTSIRIWSGCCYPAHVGSRSTQLNSVASSKQDSGVGASDE